ncbi:ABC transporter ATP-binding protein [Vibrio cyclitrophicus]|nr:ABC transporter ATP-binding protein [Vibrio cyclitrophicus]OEF24933.1 hypothetical protein OA9_16900 [Vibrio cyclitrophicus 1F97]OEF33287.1 hypothetical protein OA7_14485 [Vibrio cyclitrophicus 1F53]OEF43374.1 hypothetical protein OAC_09855 [Vibrio cyclitrophicus 1F273]OEF66699.1 hypothetical protein OAA_08120 [Vibrio cyclitrophicus 1F175]PMH36267.1 hypothetical protein BCU72_08905 [Vibrio cyclitrophicus]
MIEFKNFSFTFKNTDKPALKIDNLTINRGEKVLIMGKSGTGKSTLGYCINGLAPNMYPGTFEGGLYIDGVLVPDVDSYYKIGTIMQDTDSQFVGLTVAEDIAFSLENACKSQDNMQDIVQTNAKIVNMLDFLDTSPARLSGGQKQRVSIAGVMSNDKFSILVADEPLASLDPASGLIAIEMIDEIHQHKMKSESGCTTVIIDNRLEEVLHRHIDRIIVLETVDGVNQIIVDDTPDNLFEQNILPKVGIREPLYVTALRMAGCEVKAKDKPASLHSLDLLPYQQQAQQYFVEQFEGDGLKQLEPVLEIKGIKHHYEADKPVLRGVNFTIGRGEIVALLGNNGAGKSTLSKAIMGIAKPQEGTIILDGINITDSSISKRGESIGYVMQNPNHMFCEQMVYDEIAFGLRKKGVDESTIELEVDKLFKISGLSRYKYCAISSLSFGARRRLTIASALILKPQVVILDEPTAGQDYKHYTKLMTFIKAMNRDYGISFIFVTHDMHLTLEYADRAIVLCQGKVICDAAVQDVFSDVDILQRANLKKTTLFELSEKLDMVNPKHFIRQFINVESAGR